MNISLGLPDLGLGVGVGSSRRKERLYAINDSGEQEPVYDVNGEPIYLKRES
jgi:hypothetical protein